MQSQTTSTILMIRPVRFGFNEQTADSNAFQNADVAAQTHDTAQVNAQREFDNMVGQLRSYGVEVLVYDDTAEPHTPDSIFPNNWVSFHYSGTLVLYPMQAPNRRAERRMDIIDDLASRYQINKTVDLTHFEEEGKFLEGTGSMVLDRMNRVAFACLSSRTNPDVLAEFSHRTGYKTVLFHAVDGSGKEVYHTNVVMSIGDVFAVVCLQAIPDLDERLNIRQELENLGKRVIEITPEQMASFAGNLLQVVSTRGQKLIVMSTTAHNSLTPKQIDMIDDYARLLIVDLSTIEANGGGSARCMMAEVHLPKK